MPGPHVLVSGASIAGLTAASLLARCGWRVTVLERAPAFRDGGQNVDVRGRARDVVERMGLLAQVKDHHTSETGTVIVADNDSVIAELPSQGSDGATAELEVLRGDLARIMLDQLPPEVDIAYGDTIAAVDDTEARVQVTTGSGRVYRADLLVVAEGVRSRTRDLVLGDREGLHELGITMAFGTIPRTPADDRRWRWYNTTGRRQAHLRPDNHGTTRAILAYAHDSARPREGQEALADVDLDDAQARLRERFSDAGWHTGRILDGFAGTDDLYVDDLAQVRLPSWHRGRVCLLGDCAWCVTPIGGGGASLALIGAYVLAAQLARRLPGGLEPGPEQAEPAAALERALGDYESWMRPVVERAQRLPPGLRATAYPRSATGLQLRNLVIRVMTWGPLARLSARQSRVAETEQELPELPDHAHPPHRD